MRHRGKLNLVQLWSAASLPLPRRGGGAGCSCRRRSSRQSILLILRRFEELLLGGSVTIFPLSFNQPCLRHRKPNSLSLIVYLAPVVPP